MKRCKGCGVVLQDKEKKQLGYSLNLTKELCQRCFRLNNYGILTIDVKDDLNSDVVLKDIEEIDGLIVWIVDLLDLSGSFKLPINRYLFKRDILLVATKRDLLPKTLANKKLTDFLYKELKENGITVIDFCFLGNHAKDGLKELKITLRKYAKNNKVILIGNANSGKSTVLKALTNQEVTISRFPGTTLAISEYISGDQLIYDTPGLMNEGSCLQYIASEDLKTISVKKLNKINSYQIYEDQSFAIGGLVRIDFLKVQKVTVVFYCSEALVIHRGKLIGADELWKKHYGEMLSPVIENLADFKSYTYRKTEDKIDICINGLGFVAVSGEIQSLVVSANKNLDIVVRKGMI